MMVKERKKNDSVVTSRDLAVEKIERITWGNRLLSDKSVLSGVK